MSMKLEGKLGSFLRIETRGLIRLQTVRAVNGSTYPQKDGMEANFACSLPQVLIKHAVDWWLRVGSWVCHLRNACLLQDGCAAGWE